MGLIPAGIRQSPAKAARIAHNSQRSCCVAAGAASLPVSAGNSGRETARTTCLRAGHWAFASLHPALLSLGSAPLPCADSLAEFRKLPCKAACPRPHLHMIRYDELALGNHARYRAHSMRGKRKRRRRDGCNARRRRRGGDAFSFACGRLHALDGLNECGE